MDNRFILGTHDHVEREKHGLSVVKEHNIRCADCFKPLINIAQIKESPKENTVLAHCPYCKGTSFKCKVNGETIIEAAENLAIDDTDIEKTANHSFSSIIHLKRKT